MQRCTVLANDSIVAKIMQQWCSLHVSCRDVVFKFIHEVRADDVTFIADDWRLLPAAATTALYKDLRCSSTVASRTRRHQQLLRRSR
jgi:hypothetical protein